jgi:hypothetical protein
LGCIDQIEKADASIFTESLEVLVILRNYTPLQFPFLWFLVTVSGAGLGDIELY